VIVTILHPYGVLAWMSAIAPPPQLLGDHPKAAIDDQVKSGHREKA
jgi:hypothetical protein